MKNAKLIPALLLALASIVNLNAQDTKPSFENFIAQFPTASLPYTINAQDLQNQLESRTVSNAARLSWEYYDYLPELERSAAYSSMPVHPEPVAAFRTEKYTAVLYNLARGLARGNRSYSISVYTNDGQYVGTHFVAGVSPDSLTAVTIDEELSAEVNEYKINWALDYHENGPIGNQITAVNLVETGKFTLLTVGNPDQLVSQNMTASSNTASFAKMK